MELLHYLATLRQRRGLILLTVVVAVVAGWLGTSRQERYTTSSTIVVGIEAPVTSDQQDARSVAFDRLVLTYAAIIDSRPLAEEALERTGLPLTPGGVVARTSVVPQPGTQVLRVIVTDDDPMVAQGLANGLAEVFVDQADELGSNDGVAGGESGLSTFVLERATRPEHPLPTGLARNVVVAGVFGLIVAVGLALLLEYLDVTVKGAEDAQARLGLPVLGVIPVLSLAKGSSAGISTSPPVQR